MRIQNNVTAMNTHRMYTMNNDAVAASAKKLSSGYRINSAADDAAGLAISEKMRSQIRGLNMATKNSQDAISLVQTAEGALQETQNMLQRMNELAVQAATGTNEDLDRTALSKEFEQLKREINDVAEQTNFNNMKILDGSLSYKGYVRSAATAGVNATVETLSNSATSGAITIDTTEATAATAGAQSTAEIALGSNKLNGGTSYKVELDNGQGVKINLQNADGNEYVLEGAGTGASNGQLTIADAIKGQGGLSTFPTTGLKGTMTIDGKEVSITVKADSTTAPTKFTVETDDNVEVDFTSFKINFVEVDSSKLNEPTGTTVATGATSNVVKGQAPVAGTANKTSQTTVKVDQSKLQDGDSIKIGNKTYTFYAQPSSGTAKDANGNEVKTSASGNSVTLVYDSNDANSAAQLLKAAINGEQIDGADGVTLNATANANGTKIDAPTADTTDSAAAALGTGAGATDPAVVVGNKVTISANYTSPAGTTANADYAIDEKNAAAVNKAIAAEAKTKGTTDSTQTTIEFDIAKMKNGDQFDITIGGKTVSVTYNGESRADFMNKTVKNAIGDLGEVKGNAVIVKDKDVKVELNTKWEKEDYAGQTNALRIQVGALENEQLSISVDSMNTASLGLDDSFLSRVGNSNDQNIDLAGAAITATRNAINKVSDQRATLGAMQNRLDHKIANLKTTAENLTASESRIRDVDMAEEMTNFTKNNILSQAATAMLAQANSLPQNVLSLLG